MRKRVIIVVMTMLMGIGQMSAQRHALRLGVHAGMSMWQTDAAVAAVPGIGGGLDVAYLCMGPIGDHALLGPMIGVGIGYNTSALRLNNYHETYTNIDYYPEQMDYTVSAERYTERARQLQLEVPLMLMLNVHGLHIGAGAKWMMPLTQQRSLQLADPHVVAYYPDIEVAVPDELVTGKVQEQGTRSSAGVMPTMNVLATASLGYEWRLPYKGRVGVEAYVDYGVWNNYSHEPPRERLIDVAPILNTTYPVPEVRVGYLTDTYVSAMHAVNAGVRVYMALTHDRAKCYPCRMWLY